MAKEFLEYADITSEEAYEWYKEKRRVPSETINQFNYYQKAVRGMMSSIRTLMEESEGGVYIEGFGYFFKLKTKEYMFKDSLDNRILHQYKKACRYDNSFHPDPEFKDWTMDRTIKKHTTEREIPERYKIHFDIREAHRVAKQYERSRQENFTPKYIYKE